MITFEEDSTCQIFPDELERLNKGLDAKVFVDGKAFYLEVENDR